MIHTLLDMVSPEAWGIGAVVLITITASLYFKGKAKLQRTADEELDPEQLAQKTRWSNVFDDVEEYRNDFPDAG